MSQEGRPLFLQTVQDLPQRTLSGLSGSAALWWLACRLASGAHARPLLIVVAEREAVAPAEAALRLYLTALGSGLPVASLPADDVRAWDGLSPHPDLPRQRLGALELARRGAPAAILCSARGLIQRQLSAEALQGLILELKAGDEPGRKGLLEALVRRGYTVREQAPEPGTVSLKGGVMDIWPIGPQGDRPVRIEFFDEEIEGIRALDPRSRRGQGPLPRLRLLPAREAVVDEAALERASEGMRRAVDAMGGGHSTRRRMLEELREGLWFPGAEDFTPLLQPCTDTLDHFSEVALIEASRVEAELCRFAELQRQRWLSHPVELRPPILPEERYADPQCVLEGLKGAWRLGELVVADPPPPDAATRDNADLRVRHAELAPVAARLAAWLGEGWQVALVVDSASRAERVMALLQPHGLRPERSDPPRLLPPGRLALWLGELERGFHSPHSRLAIVGADELFGAKERSRSQGVNAALRDAGRVALNLLRAGDLVVHSRHGVGRFQGLKRLALPGRDGAPEQDYAEVTYRNGDRLLLPVERLDQLYQYRSVGEKDPQLDRLGGVTWAARKSAAFERIARMAHELLEQHAMRKIREGHAYEGLPALYHAFVESFPFVETPDQAAAIDEVLEDLARPEAMDRLIVGDVGFGKTEVAMRAALRVVLEGRQVAVLCPTTVLAFQHARTFQERFVELPLRIELLSSFRSAGEQRQLQRELAEGKVDIAIGTASLLARDVGFRDLGLVVVDEEHRFGVKQKERLKKVALSRSGVPCDYIAMSATPIPRSLHMALSGLRDVSVIATPPPSRRPVLTRIQPWDDARIQEELRYELQRGGQVFFVHNRIETIDRIALRLQELVPEARFGVGHGQMEDKVLERVLVDFVQRRFHVLVCTTIIETGVDMPNVNTILINDAHELGLAALYQLRGRVGRGAARGHCTLLVPDDPHLTTKATRRLRVLQEHTELGAGMAIANADLELRGSGDLLGASQHGQIEAVGLDTYVELLEQAIAAARGEVTRSRLDPEIEVPVPALLPAAWIPDVDQRVLEYRRLAACRSVEAVRDVIGAWEDEHGTPPPEVLNLGWQAEARVRARALGIEKVAWLKVRALLDLHETSTIPAERIARLLKDPLGRFSQEERAPAGCRARLAVRFTPEEAQYPFRFLHWAFRKLEEG